MANNIHGYVSTTRCACVDVDAYNRAGVATTDMDNGTLVSISGINADAISKVVKGFEFNVAAPVANATGLWLVDSPVVGTTLEMQLLSDPRYFYNPAKQPMSLKYMVAGIDCIEADANCFANSTLPTTAQGYVSVNTSGKYVAANSAPASGTYFTVVGFHTTDVGQELMATVILQCARN